MKTSMKKRCFGKSEIISFIYIYILTLGYEMNVNWRGVFKIIKNYKIVSERLKDLL
jgi:hypothetical protein